ACISRLTWLTADSFSGGWNTPCGITKVLVRLSAFSKGVVLFVRVSDFVIGVMVHVPYDYGGMRPVCYRDTGATAARLTCKVRQPCRTAVQTGSRPSRCRVWAVRREWQT